MDLAINSHNKLRVIESCTKISHRIEKLVELQSCTAVKTHTKKKGKEKKNEKKKK